MSFVRQYRPEPPVVHPLGHDKVTRGRGATRLRRRWHHGVVPRNWPLERFAGKFVAIDVRTDEVVLAADAPQELHAEFQARGLRNVATMRAPREDEPLFVGGN